jgi:hypothetical protein
MFKEEKDMAFGKYIIVSPMGNKVRNRDNNWKAVAFVQERDDGRLDHSGTRG